MINKKRTVLVIGIIILVLTFFVLIFCYISEYRKTENDSTSDSIDQTITNVFYIFVGLPVLLEEIILLRSVYKLLNVNTGRVSKICYTISAILNFFASVFQILVFTNIITKDIFPVGPTASSSRLVMLLILTEWPVIIVSLVLSGLQKKHRDCGSQRFKLTDSGK